jgi:hypothetical protein
MSDTNNDFVFDDEFFSDYAKSMKAEEKKNTSNFTRDLEEVQYAACEPGKNKIFRFLGIPPKAKLPRRFWDPKNVIMSDVKSDDGKRFTLKLPIREDNPANNHIIHRLYDRINEVAWINKQKVSVNEAKFPDLIKKSNKMGFTPEDGDIPFKSATGLKGSKYVIYNVIDRHDDWCKENKHAKILASSVNKDDKGRIWGKPGIKEFGFIQKLVDLIDKYKLPEDYDIAIKRIAGAKTDPWELRNASAYAQKDMMEELKNDDGTLPDKNIIVIGPLTEEEKNYTKYDLDKFYGPTTYQTILKRISSIFKETDASLKTKFYDELLSLVEDEKKRFDEIYRNKEKDTAQKESEEVEKKVEEPEIPKRRTIVGPVESELSPEKIAALKGWSKLSDSERSLIKDVFFKVDGSVKEIVWVECAETENLLACDECNMASPETFSACPVCSSNFL